MKATVDPETRTFTLRGGGQGDAWIDRCRCNVGHRMIGKVWLLACGRLFHFQEDALKEQAHSGTIGDN
ncbi:MAG TPA: hypothetical protein VGV39_11420 [Mesorhizobium sp.]|uniref:hypothetical protein n=1 Tax=Mesorhizobium sp. TaxID=1871066 RepID=UPI002DDD15B7|nr:hypothetical protein [Mesorhizobium sp.]HEV2503680.1 hypothetical protein [Mesorhizobium sp.]